MTSKDASYEFQSDNSLLVTVRRETRADAPYMLELFDHLSPESSLARFNDRTEDVDRDQLTQEAVRLAQLASGQGTAWLAFADLPSQRNAPIAGVRYIRLGPYEANLALVVRDDLQRQGIGSHLLNFALREACADGIRKIVARFQRDNEAVWQLLHYSPYHVTWRPEDSAIEVTIHLQALPSPAEPQFEVGV